MWVDPKLLLLILNLRAEFLNLIEFKQSLEDLPTKDHETYFEDAYIYAVHDTDIDFTQAFMPSDIQETYLFASQETSSQEPLFADIHTSQNTYLETGTTTSEFDGLIDGDLFTDQDKVSESHKHTPEEMSPTSMRSVRAPTEQGSDSTVVVDKSIEVALEGGDQLPDQPVDTVPDEEVATCRSTDGIAHFETSPKKEVPALVNKTEANTPRIFRGGPGSKGGRRGRTGRPPGRPRGRQPVSPTTDIATLSDSVSTATDRGRKRHNVDEGKVETPAKRTRGASVVTIALPFPPEGLARLASPGGEKLEAVTPLDDRAIESALEAVAGIAPYNVTLISSLADRAKPGLNRKTDPEPINLIPIRMTQPEPSWLLGVLNSTGMRLLDPMPAKSRTQESKKRLERLFGDQHVDLQPITEVDCVLQATGADTGVSIVINAMQAILASCGVQKSLPSTVDFALWWSVIVRLLKAAADKSYDPSWDDDLEPDMVSLPGNDMESRVLWSSGSGRGPFQVNYQAALEDIKRQLQYLYDQKDHLDAARNDKIQARAREAGELRSIGAVLEGLMEATAQQAGMLETQKTKYRDIVEMLIKDPSEEDMFLLSATQERLEDVDSRQSQRGTMEGAVRRVVEALDQRVKDLEAKQDF
ncbi:hypothetical protein F5883DRAFT_593660 [Diaporthe sp. PMI_573]|nr:hypothetical protein F5883DRAFT_593660 [Diaporthaceae sp. PMI_573]